MTEELDLMIPGNQDVVNDSSSPNSYLSRSQSRKSQDYTPFRSSYRQTLNNPDSTSRSSRKNSANQLDPQFSQVYMRTTSYLDDDQNVQQYHRHRNSTSRSPRKMSSEDGHFTFPCYSQLANSTENEYSKFKDAQSPRKTSTNGFIENTYQKPHYRCRSLVYDDNAQRFPVSDNKVFWNIPFPEYTPVEYTTDRIQHNPRADPVDPWKIDSYNKIDKKIDRRSFTGLYYVNPKTNRPRNPMGRTGLTGRGRLYYWGPNHAGDPVVTRWLRNKDGSIVHRRLKTHDQLKPVLEFVCIQRRDTKEWALPGGMVDPNEQVSQTIKREFQEEAIRDGADKNCINELFSNGYKLYESYVDDPRNTDNAWIETVAEHYHDETGLLTKHLNLQGGSDAEKAVWHRIDHKLELYANHKNIIKAAVDRLGAYW